MVTEVVVRTQFPAALERHRAVLRRWRREGIDRGDRAPITGNALASDLLALSGGLLFPGERALPARAGTLRRSRARAVEIAGAPG
ncbi:MAG TPA: hypothetical protein VNF24_02385 [Candidatus Acidoferrales bacterium]|nr:hypothetical protein [Candidatus Acidoferrales bacterium]